MKTFVVIFLILVFSFQLWVSYRVVRSKSYQRDQKSAQLGFIWMLPALGATIAFMMLRDVDEHDRRGASRDRQDQH